MNTRSIPSIDWDSLGIEKSAIASNSRSSAAFSFIPQSISFLNAATPSAPETAVKLNIKNSAENAVCLKELATIEKSGIDLKGRLDQYLRYLKIQSKWVEDVTEQLKKLQRL